METEYLVVDESGEGQEVKEISEVFPDIRVTVFPQTLVVKTVHLGDLTRFVVAAEDGDALRITDLQSDEESHGLNGIVATVDIITFR